MGMTNLELVMKQCTKSHPAQNYALSGVGVGVSLHVGER